MKTYLKFAAGFWMSAFLAAGSMGAAQTTSTTKAKKKQNGTTTPAPKMMVDPGQHLIPASQQ